MGILVVPPFLPLPFCEPNAGNGKNPGGGNRGGVVGGIPGKPGNGRTGVEGTVGGTRVGVILVVWMVSGTVWGRSSCSGKLSRREVVLTPICGTNRCERLLTGLNCVLFGKLEAKADVVPTPMRGTSPNLAGLLLRVLIGVLSIGSGNGRRNWDLGGGCAGRGVTGGFCLPSVRVPLREVARPLNRGVFSCSVTSLSIPCLCNSPTPSENICVFPPPILTDLCTSSASTLRRFRGWLSVLAVRPLSLRKKKFLC